MCVSAGPTNFSGTVTGIYEAAENLHVAFYANTVQRDSSYDNAPPFIIFGGNALLLPIFGVWETIKAIDLTDAPNVLNDIRAVVGGPSSASFGIGMSRGVPDVIIEQIGCGSSRPACTT